MTRSSRNEHNNAKSSADADAGTNRRGRRFLDPVLQTLHGLYRADYVKHVRRLVDRHPRTLELWKTGERTPDGAAVVELLSSEIGEHIWLAILKTVPHRWADDWRRAHELVCLDREEREIKRKRALLRGVDT